MSADPRSSKGLGLHGSLCVAAAVAAFLAAALFLPGRDDLGLGARVRPTPGRHAFDEPTHHP